MYLLFDWCCIGIVMLLDFVKTCWVAMPVERLLLLDGCPQVVLGQELRIQPCPLCGNLCAHLGSIPKIY